MAFQDERTMVRLALLIPGGGYFYTGHPVLGRLDFLAEAYPYYFTLTGLLVPFGVRTGFFDDSFSPGDPIPVPLALILAAFWAAVLAAQKWFAIRHCRRLLRKSKPAAEAPSMRRHWIEFLVFGCLVTAMLDYPLLIREMMPDEWVSYGMRALSRGQSPGFEEMPLLYRIIVGLGFFFSRFGWVLVPFLVAGSFVFAPILDWITRKTPRPSPEPS